MIPPIDPAIIDSNPNFARLHARLTSTLLGPDGSTAAKNHTHTSTASALRQRQIANAGDEILKHSLSNLVGLENAGNGTDSVLPAPLRDLVYTLALYISEGPSMNLSADDHELMAAEVDKFREHLPQICKALSDHLQAQQNALLAMASHDSPAQSHAGAKPTNATLQSRIESLQAQLSLHTTLPPLQSALSTLLTLTPLHSAHLTAQITHLERHVHGTLSRHAQARAAHLSAVASALALKSRVMHLSTLKATYTSDMQGALGDYASHLREEEQRLRERQDALRGIVGEYDGVKLAEAEAGDGETVMRQLGLKYGEILKEIDDVQADIRSLEKEAAVKRPNR